MKALLIKDWMTTKSLIKNYLMILVIYGFIAYTNRNVYLFSGLMVMIPLLMVINSVAYDERNHTVRLLIASGISRRQLALCKYLFAFVLLSVMTVINVAVAGIVEGFMESLLASLALALAGMTYVSVLIPVIFHFGTEKARIYMMLGVVIPLLAGAGFSALSNVISLQISEVTVAVLIMLACVLVICGSIFLSIQIVEKKDYS